MGFLISKFRKKKSTSDQLDAIEQKISNIEKFQKETEQQSRRVIGKLIVGSITIYILALVGYYYYYSPDTFIQNIPKFIPLLVFPFIIILSRKLLSWYYERKLFKNELILKTLKANKRKILEEVMDKETYKVAKEILEKYASEQLNKDSVRSVTSPVKALVPSTPASNGMVARQRLLSATTASKKFSETDTPIVPKLQSVPATPSFAQLRMSLTRPILPRERGAFDKLVDMIIGDGPGNRYALICRMCCSHNGMALKNEFEYLAFRCAYCLQWNPARKQKPHAPNLILEIGGSQDDSDNSETGSTCPVNSTIASPANTDMASNSENDSTKVVEENAGASETNRETSFVDENSSVKSLTNSEVKEVAISAEKVDLSDIRQSSELE